LEDRDKDIKYSRKELKKGAYSCRYHPAQFVANIII